MQGSRLCGVTRGEKSNQEANGRCAHVATAVVSQLARQLHYLWRVQWGGGGGGGGVNQCSLSLSLSYSLSLSVKDPYMVHDGYMHAFKGDVACMHADQMPLPEGVPSRQQDPWPC